MPDNEMQLWREARHKFPGDPAAQQAYVSKGRKPSMPMVKPKTKPYMPTVKEHTGKGSM